MPTPCRVCSSLHRPEIDARLVQHVVNIAELSRDYDIPRKSIENHRDQHLPTFLRVYGAAADLPTLGQLHAEALRVYMQTLDELGRAQAGVLIDIGDDGTQVRRVSHTAIARMLDGARKSVDQLARLAADAGTETERPSGMANGELTERMQVALARVVARQLHGDASGSTPSLTSVHDDAVVIDSAQPQEQTEQGEPGGLVGGAPVPTPNKKGRDAVMALETLPGLTPRARKTVADDVHTRELPPPLEDSPVITVPNPRYPGSIASSTEERTAAGYPDITITLEDIKSNADLVAQLVEGHRQTQAEADLPD